jgi:FkbM family methyltransferase
MDTRIDFETAKKFDQLDLVDWKTQYGDFQFYLRKGLKELQYNVSANVARSETSGEYIRPFVHPNMGTPLNLTETLNREDTWLDVGGHLGLFAIRMAKQFPKIKKVVSYEALPHNTSFALENIKLNGLEETCEFVQKAIVPDNSESIDFFISSDSGKHSIIPVKGRDVISVPAVNINDVIKETGATAIKMDVEGAEYSLLKAVTDWSQIRVVVIEWHFNAMRPLKKGDSNARVNMFHEIMEIMEKNFDHVRRWPNAEYQKNFITHFVALKTNA